MSAVVPFPLSRRRPLVAKCARRMTELSADAAEHHLQRLLQQQADTLSRKGVHTDLVVMQVRGLEAAVRAELWRAILAPGGAA